MSKLHIMDRTGDREIPFTMEEHKEAEKVFNEHLNKNYLAYRMDANSRTGEQIRSFDGQAETIIMNPPLVGG